MVKIVKNGPKWSKMIQKGVQLEVLVWQYDVIAGNNGGRLGKVGGKEPGSEECSVPSHPF